MKKLYLMGLTYIGVAIVALVTARRAPVPLPVCECEPLPDEIMAFPASSASVDPRIWFQQIRPRCNYVEVQTALENSPGVSGWEGIGYRAACLGLAGRIGLARDLIISLNQPDRWRAVGIVFQVAHPVADMGDDVAAGPMMELTVEFWPNHYMALYHAGAARYELGQFDRARGYLERFLDNYHQDDGWTASANTMLGELSR